MRDVVRLNQAMWRIIVCVAALAAAGPLYSIEPKGSDVAVAVVVGAKTVPLGVKHRFREAAGALPKPGALPVNDRHDQRHDSRTYCYRFGAKGHKGMLEFFDSNFGMHTARLSRVPDEKNPECTDMPSEPRFDVNGKSFSLKNKSMPTLPGFVEEKKDNVLVLKRQWTYTDSSRPHQWGNCFSREVSIEAKPGKGGFSTITVMNWDEPGC
jgi:hypothetical protein